MLDELRVALLRNRDPLAFVGLGPQTVLWQGLGTGTIDLSLEAFRILDGVVSRTRIIALNPVSPSNLSITSCPARPPATDELTSLTETGPARYPIHKVPRYHPPRNQDQLEV
jgi:hypothetical protein